MTSIPPSNQKEFAYDGKGAISGNPEPNPEKSDVEMVSDHGIELNKNKPLQTKAVLDQHDEQRWDLDPESKAS